MFLLSFLVMILIIEIFFFSGEIYIYNIFSIFFSKNFEKGKRCHFDVFSVIM